MCECDITSLRVVTVLPHPDYMTVPQLYMTSGNLEICLNQSSEFSMPKTPWAQRFLIFTSCAASPANVVIIAGLPEGKFCRYCFYSSMGWLFDQVEIWQLRAVDLRPQNFENLEFYQYNCPWGAGPLHDSYKIYKVYARPQST